MIEPAAARSALYLYSSERLGRGARLTPPPPGVQIGRACGESGDFRILTGLGLQFLCREWERLDSARIGLV